MEYWKEQVGSVVTTDIFWMRGEVWLGLQIKLTVVVAGLQGVSVCVGREA